MKSAGFQSSNATVLERRLLLPAVSGDDCFLCDLNCKKKSGNRSLLLLWRRPALCGLSSRWVSAFAVLGDVAGVPNLSLPTDLPRCSLPELLPSARAPHEQCHGCCVPQAGPGPMQWPEWSLQWRPPSAPPLSAANLPSSRWLQPKQRPRMTWNQSVMIYMQQISHLRLKICMSRG